jgi:hypothetical protein
MNLEDRRKLACPALVIKNQQFLSLFNQKLGPIPGKPFSRKSSVNTSRLGLIPPSKPDSFRLALHPGVTARWLESKHCVVSLLPAGARQVGAKLPCGSFGILLFDAVGGQVPEFVRHPVDQRLIRPDPILVNENAPAR